MAYVIAEPLHRYKRHCLRRCPPTLPKERVLRGPNARNDTSVLLKICGNTTRSWQAASVFRPERSRWIQRRCSSLWFGTAKRQDICLRPGFVCSIAASCGETYARLRRLGRRNVMGPEQPGPPEREQSAADSFVAQEPATATSMNKEHETDRGGFRCRICGQEGAVAPSSWPES